MNTQRQIQGRDAFTLIDVDPRVKCAIVTGHGRMFCAGADLDTGFKGGEEAVRVDFAVLLAGFHRRFLGHVAIAAGGRLGGVVEGPGALTGHRARLPVVVVVESALDALAAHAPLPADITRLFSKYDARHL